MLWLQTFAGPIVFDGEGQPRLAAGQRRSVGLLSVLAVAGNAGISRDKIVGVLWPDVAPGRARHSLTQALYSARRNLESEDLFEGGEDLRLNPGRIRSDIAAFEAALLAGREVEAVRLYHGPFLDGLFPATPVFERWVDSHRASYEERVVAALKQLVERAVASGDHGSAVKWLRDLVAIRPSDSAITIQLMNALAHTGDREAAVQRAQLHAKVLRDDFEQEADEQVIAFAERLRATRTVVAMPEIRFETAGPEISEAVADGVRATAYRGAVEAGRFTVLSTDLTHARQERQQARRRRTWALVVALPLLLVIGFFLKPEKQKITALSERILVAPFRIVGEDASLDYLREGMVELLSARLADDSAAPAVDAGAVIQAWRRAGVGRSADPPRDSVVSLAARFGAERVIVGSIVGTPRRAVMSASVISAVSREVHGEGRVEGPVDSLTTLVDRLAAQLLASQAGLQPSLAQRTSTSLPALRAFLAAASAYGRGDFAIAAERYQKALAFDSTFGTAALRLALTARQLNSFQLERQALARAWRFRTGLNQRDDAHLVALVGPRYPAVSSEKEVLAAWEEALRASPDRPEILYGFAAHVAERNGYKLAGHQREQAMAALERALAIDPGYGFAHLLRSKFTSDSSLDSAGPVTPFLRWQSIALHADPSARQQMADSLTFFGPATLRAIATVSQFDGTELGMGSRAVSILQRRASTADEGMDLLLAEYSFRQLTADPTAVTDLTRAMQRLRPTTRAHLRLRVLDWIYGDADSMVALQAAAELQREFKTRQSRSSAADACVLGQWAAARGDTAALRDVLTVLESTPASEPLTAGSPPGFCIPLLTAAHAVHAGQSNARDHVLSLDTLMLTIPAAGDLAVVGHIASSRLYRRLGDAESALVSIRRRPYLSGGWPRYLATAHLEEGELAQIVGDVPGAVDAYTRYLTLRSGSADVRVALVTAVRDSLAAQLPGGDPR